MQKIKNRAKKKIKLKKLKVSDFSNEYIMWLNNPETVKYTEQRYKKNSRKDIEKFVNNINKSKDSFLYGIYIEKNNKEEHVGNIKIGPINFNHKSSYISYLIGSKQFTNQGIATQAIYLIIDIAKKKFKLKKLFAGVYSMNKASRRVLIKNKFKCEGILKSSILFKNRRYDSMIYGKIL